VGGGGGGVGWGGRVEGGGARRVPVGSVGVLVMERSMEWGGGVLSDGGGKCRWV